jgi:hypothetical protein
MINTNVFFNFTDFQVELNNFIAEMWPTTMDPNGLFGHDQSVVVSEEIFLTMDWDGSVGLDIAEYVFLLGNTDVSRYVLECWSIRVCGVTLSTAL